MKRKKFSIKKALSLVMTVVMCVGAVPTVALAATGPKINRYVLTPDGRLEITDATTAKGASITDYGITCNLHDVPTKADVGTEKMNMSWQSSPVFTDLTRGVYYLYVRDSEGNVSPSTYAVNVFDKEDVEEIFFSEKSYDTLKVGDPLPETGSFGYSTTLTKEYPDGTWKSSVIYTNYIESSMYGSYDNTTPGVIRVPVTSSYGDVRYREFTFDDVIVSIDVEDPCTEYYQEDPFKEQGNIIVHWKCGPDTRVPLIAKYVKSFNTWSAGGPFTRTVTYEKMTTTFSIMVHPKSVVKIKAVGAELGDETITVQGVAKQPLKWTLPEPRSMDGKTFLGYSLTKDGSNLVAAGTEVVLSKYDVTYYAIYESEPMCITVSGAKTNYMVDEEFVEQGTVTLYDQDMNSEDIPLTKDMVKNFSTATPGRFSVVVEYLGQVTSYYVTVAEATPIVTDVTVDGAETHYFVGEYFKPGGNVVLHCSDGTMEEVPLTEDMLRGFDTSQPGDVVVTVECRGETVEYTISVAAPTLSKITLRGQKTEYLLGEDFVGQGTVTSHYNDGSTKEIPLAEEMLSGFDTSVEGTVTVTVNCEGLTATFDINVIARVPVLEGLSVRGEAKDYLVGDSFKEQGVLMLHYDDGTTNEIPLVESMLYAFDTSTPGTQYLTVEYAGITVTFEITVREDIVPVLESIEVVGATTRYEPGADFEEVGTVELHFSDGSMRSVPLTEDMVSGFSTMEVGTVIVTVTVDGVCTTYEIVVDVDNEELEDPWADALDVVGAVTEYRIGDKFVEQGTVIVKHSDGSRDRVPLTEDLVSGFDTSKEGYVTVTVSYDGKTTTYQIFVKSEDHEEEEMPKTCVVTLDGNGIAGVVTQKFTTKIGAWRFPSAPVIAGKVFKGYATNPSGEGKMYVEGASIVVDGDIVFYFVYENKPIEPTRPSRPSGSGGGGGSHRKRPVVAKPVESVTKVEQQGAAETSSRGNGKFELKEGINLVDLGGKPYIYGYPDGSFRAEAGITRAEFAAILCRVFEFSDKTVTTEFTDVAKDAWYADAVRLLASRGIIYGVGDGKFSPDANITMEEAILMVSRVVKLEGFSAETQNASIAASKVSGILAQAVNSGMAEFVRDLDVKTPISRGQTVMLVDSVVRPSSDAANK